jgi:acetylornithine deacetylase
MAPLTDVEIRTLDSIDAAETVGLLAELVRIPSITGTDAEADLQHRAAEMLRDAGLDVDFWQLDLDALRADPSFPGAEAPRAEGHGVVGTSEGDGKPGLILQGHVDVVPTGDPAKWDDGDPWSARITGNTLHGRGACDMKAGVAANIAVARAVQRARIPLRRPLAVHCVISEEDGGLGAFATMMRGHTGAAAVITEPTSGAIITANAGALTFRLEVPGRAAHGSIRYEGVSALEAFWPLHEAIRALEETRNERRDPLLDQWRIPYPISIGAIRAGDWASNVPDRLVADGRLGVKLGEPPEEARAALETCVADACAIHPWLNASPARVTWPGGQFASGRLPPGHVLLDQVSAAVADTTRDQAPPEAGAPYGSDLRLYAAAGIPTLHYGPGDVRFAHAPREQVDLRELLQVSRALTLLAVRRCAAP